LNRKIISLCLAILLTASSTIVLNPYPLSFADSQQKSDPVIESAVQSRNNLANELKMNVKQNVGKGSSKLSTELNNLIFADNDPVNLQDQEEIISNLKKNNAHLTVTEAALKGLQPTDGELVYVYISLNELAQIEEVEGLIHTITHFDPNSNLIAAWVELENLNLIAMSEAVSSVRSVLPPQVHSGSVLSQGDSLMGADEFRQSTGVNGSGIKIGIISNGVDHWTLARDTGNLPSDLVVLSNTLGGDEGTAMLEIIHDLAPNAELVFHDSGDNIIAFNNAISELIDAGCDIVCDDIGWIGEPFFEDGIIAQHVRNELNSNNVLYFSSAGNDAERHYQGQFNKDAYNFHDFSSLYGAQSLPVIVPANQTLMVVLQWNDRFGSSSNDYDLFLSDINYNLASYSVNIQNGYNDPLEYIIWENPYSYDVYMNIDMKSYASVTKTMELFVYGGSILDYGTTADSIYGHPAVSEVIAVGAINAGDPNSIAPYSSQGNVTISYPASQIRKKPDLAAIDGVSVTGAGGFPSTFFGTSAAAPHAAAVAALVWSQSPDKTATQIKSMLLNGAYDLGAVGNDTIYGYGRLDAILAGTPATPKAFNASASGSGVRLTWQSNSETDLSNYQLDYKAKDSTLWSNTIISKTSTYFEITSLTLGKEYEFRLKAKDTQGNWSNYTDIIRCTPLDLSAPPIPTGLKITSVNDNQISLAWSAVLASDLAGYNIEYQAEGTGNWLQTGMIGKVTSFTITGLENNTLYHFRISSEDLSGNKSVFSSAVAGTPMDRMPPMIPFGLTAIPGSNREIALNWTVGAEADLERYEIAYQKYGSSTWITIPLTGESGNTTVENLTHNTKYGFKLRAMDEAGNWSNYSTVIYAIAKDMTAPGIPIFKTVQARDKSIFVEWNLNPESDLNGYQLEYKSVTAATWTIKAQAKTVTSFTLTSLINGSEYQLRLKSKDAAGNWSEYTDIQSAMPRDTIAPPTPTGLKINATNDKLITLVWSAVSATDLAGYHVEYKLQSESGWHDAGAVGKITTFTVTGLENEMPYDFRIFAADTSGNVSGYSLITVGTPVDKMPPSVPLGLNAIPDSSKNILLTWNENTEVDFAGYELVYQKYGSSLWLQVPLAEGDHTGKVENLIHNTKYGFKLRAKDLKGNWSAYTGVIYSTAKDLVPPEPPVVTTIEVIDKSLLIHWAPNTEIDLGGYQLEYKTSAASAWTVKAQTSAVNTYKINYLVNGTEYQVRLKAKDAAGNWSAYSEIEYAVPKDQIAPAAPAGLKVISLNDQQVTLGWSQLSAADLKGYEIEFLKEGDLEWTEAGAVGKVTAFTVNGLENDQVYSFRIRVLDTSGNNSAYSASVTGTPADKMPPAIPTGLIVVPGTNQDISVTWTANTEADFAAYNLVYQKYGTSTWITVPLENGMTSAHVEGLIHNVRYNFKIQAVDLKNNWSVFSAVKYAVAKDLVAPETPVLSTVTPGNRSLSINWLSNLDTDLYGYQLEYKTVSAVSWSTKTLSKTLTNTTINYLTNGLEYQIRIKAKDNAGNWSPYSEILNGMPISY